MSRIRRIAFLSLGALAGLVVVAIVAALIIVQTQWFRNLVRERIVAEVEKATGGRAEISGFTFSPGAWRAEVTGFVLHGTEGAGEPPLVRARSLVVVLKIVSVFKRQVDIDTLAITQPQVFVKVNADGSTNIPEPKVKRQPSGKDPLQTVMDLAVRHFRITDGLLQFADRKTPLDLRAENFRTLLRYELLGPKYTGTIAMSPVYFQSGSRPSLPLNIEIPVTIASGRIAVNAAKIETSKSNLRLTAELSNLAAPVASLQLQGRVMASDVVPSFASPQDIDLKSAPPLDIDVRAGLAQSRVRVDQVRLAMGASELVASGAMGADATSTVQFRGNVALDEVGRVMRLAQRPDGVLRVDGGASLAPGGDYQVTAKAEAARVSFVAGGRRYSGVSLRTDVTADEHRVALNGIQLGALGGTFSGEANIRKMDRYEVSGKLAGFDLKQLVQRFAARNMVWDGVLSGPVSASGSLKGASSRQTVARALITIAPGTQGVPVSGRIDATYDGPRDSINVGNSYIALPNTRLVLAGPVNREMRIGLVTRNLDDFLPALAMASENPPQQLPARLDTNGVLRVDATVSGRLSDAHLAGHIGADNLLVHGQRVDRLAADVEATKSGAAVRNASVRQGKLDAQLDGSVALAEWKTSPSSAIAASAKLSNARVEDLLAMAGQAEMRISGALNATAQASGTLGDPHAALDASIVNGAAYDEPFERIEAKANYSARSIELTSASVVTPAGRVDATASFEHPPDQLRDGRVRFHVASNSVEIARLRSVQQSGKRVAGRLELKADGEGLLQSAPGRPAFVPVNLTANLSAAGVEMEGKPFGNLTVSAGTANRDLVLHMESDLAQSNLRGDGTVGLAGDYPVNLKLAIAPLRIEGVRALAASRPETEPGMTGVVEGTVEIAGPAMRPAELHGTARFAKIEVNAPGERPLTLRNPEPAVIALDRSVVRIEHARLTGPSSDFSIEGSVDLNRQNALDVRARGNVDLGIAKQLDPNMLAEGTIALDATVKGNASQPLVNGRLLLKNASFHMLDLPNGLSDANGEIVFNGTQAVIQKLTGETGGGKLTLSGYARFAGDDPDFRLEARANRVRIRYPETITTTATARLTLAGTAKQSSLTGNVRIDEVAFHSHTDFGSVLSGGGPPSSSSGTSSGFTAGMRMDVSIETAPEIQFQTPLTQNLEAAARLQLRGTAARPGMVGQVNVTRGDVVFFGNKYTIDRGTVAFYNQQKIDPILDAVLSTSAAGIDVTLMVSGPVDKLNLTYQSDPPLQFSDIVGLLATGKAPTTDPVLAAQQPQAPQQSTGQKGESALLSQAVAAPVSGRLQRLFGVTKLKIDPQIIGAENTPQARLTLQQQITRDLNFTYIQDLTSSNPQVIRIEWAIDPTWSAIAVRQDTGQFGIDFYYKKRFR